MKEQAQSRYGQLRAERENFLDTGRRCASLTLPYLLTEEGETDGGVLHSPYQSVGAKGVNVLSSKLMLSLFPINTSFFKLQINDAELAKVPELGGEQVRSEIDLSLSKIEKVVMQQIAETTDRVQLTAAMKHLIVTGNALLYAGKKSLKLYPLDRYVVNRDGDGTVIEIITKEIIDRSLLPKEFQSIQPGMQGPDSNAVGEDGPKFGVATGNKNSNVNNAVVYTHVTLENGSHKWYQECDGKRLKGQGYGSAPLKHSPWMTLRFNVVDGESYGRGRVEEFFGDLQSLESLMQAMVEGSSAAAKVVFLVSPSATTKPQSLAKANNGAIIQGRPDDVGVVQVGKTADFRTVMEMIQNLTQRLSDAFLVLSVRQSERTTAMEVQATQQELNEQLGGIFGSLTAELLQPYLNRKLHLLSRSGGMPPLPKGLIMPTVVAGLYGVGRGQDRQALIEFVQTIAQGMGPEAMAQHLNAGEFIKRLATASGIDALGLVKGQEQMKQEGDQMKQDAMQASLVGQAGQLAKSPMAEQLTQQMADGQQQQQEAPPQEGPEA
jgi:vacuolar-type H+-ATPase subunit E/Vma4